LQWDKLPQQQAAKTVWASEEVQAKEAEWVSKLQSDGVWQEMEEGFKAKQLVATLVGKSAFDNVRRFDADLFYSCPETSGTQECP
jgi:hypothetical protein